MKRLGVVMLGLGVLAGCNSGGQNVKKDFSFVESNTTGLMVISTRMEPNQECLRPMNSLVMSYRNNDYDGDKSNGLLNLKNPMISNDFSDPEGYFYIHELTPGSYSFKNIAYMGPGYAGTKLSGSDFEILPNKANYLGEVVVKIKSCGTQPGDTKATLTFSDQSKRDSVLFRGRVPNVNVELDYQVVGQ